MFPKLSLILLNPVSLNKIIERIFLLVSHSDKIWICLFVSAAAAGILGGKISLRVNPKRLKKWFAYTTLAAARLGELGDKLCIISYLFADDHEIEIIKLDCIGRNR